MLLSAHLTISFGRGSLPASPVNPISLVLRLNAREKEKRERAKREIPSSYALVATLAAM